MKSILELIKYIVEIVAIVVAGLWAYSKYIETEKPLFRTRSASISYLRWFRTGRQDTCMASLEVTIKNIGTKPFYVEKINTSAWLLDRNMAEDGIVYFDPKKEKRVLLDRRIFNSKNSTSLVGEYGPDEENQQHFTYLVKASESNIAMLELQALGPEIDIEESRWSYVCDIEHSPSQAS